MARSETQATSRSCASDWTNWDDEGSVCDNQYETIHDYANSGSSSPSHSDPNRHMSTGTYNYAYDDLHALARANRAPELGRASVTQYNDAEASNDASSPHAIGRPTVVQYAPLDGEGEDSGYGESCSPEVIGSPSVIHYAPVDDVGGEGERARSARKGVAETGVVDY